MLKKISALLLMLSFVSLIAGTATFGSITELKGKATLIKGGTKRKAVKGLNVSEGNTVITENNAWVMIKTRQGDLIKVRPSTRLKISKNKIQNRSDGSTINLALGIGSVACKVNKLSKTSSFNVHTPTIVAGVRGTDFAVAAGIDGNTVASVDEGEVLVDNGKGKASVNPGQNAKGELASDKAPESQKDDIDMDNWIEENNKKAEEDPEETLEKMKEHLEKVESDAKKLAEESEKENQGESAKKLAEKESEGLELNNKQVSIETANNELFNNAQVLAGKDKKLQKELSAIERINRSISDYNKRINAALERLDKKLAEAYKRIDDSYEKSDSSKAIDNLFDE